MSLLVMFACFALPLHALVECELAFAGYSTVTSSSSIDGVNWSTTSTQTAEYEWTCWQEGSDELGQPVPPKPSGGGGWPTFTPNPSVDSDGDGEIDCWHSAVVTTDPNAYTLDNNDRLGTLYASVGGTNTTRPDHNGIDIQANVGDPIQSPSHGYVVENAYNSLNGNYIRIRYRSGVECVFLHMRDRSSLPVGARVNVGAVVGFVGMTGRTTGPHLHFTLYDGPSATGNVINPATRHARC